MRKEDIALKFAIMLFIWIALIGVAGAQPTATSDQSLAWDYTDQMMNDLNVTHFNIMFDGDTDNPQNIVNAGKNRLGTMESYFHPFPALNTGSHVANLQTCNSGGCGTWSGDFNFRIGVLTAPSNIRVVDTPEPQ